jgi:diguanylate cyclase (GGDEF)-like protein
MSPDPSISPAEAGALPRGPAGPARLQRIGLPLSVRFALYFVVAIVLASSTALLIAGYFSTADLATAEQRLRRDLKYSLILDQQAALSGIASFLGRRLEAPLRARDSAALNGEIADLRAWMPLKHVEIVDAQRRLVADGSASPRIGEPTRDDHLFVFDLAAPHIYSLPAGYGMAFRIGQAGEIAGYAHIEIDDISFAESIERATGAVDAIASGLRQTFLAIAGAALLASLAIGLVVSFFLSRRLSLPLKTMSEAARRYASGDFSYQIHLRQRDELGVLADSLNSMARDLWRSNRHLAEAQSVARLGSWEYDAERARFEWSDQCYVIFGSLRGGFEPGLERVSRKIAPEDRTRFLEFFLSDATRRAGGTLEFVVERYPGQICHVQLLAESNRAAGSGRLIGTIQDVSERKLTEDRLSRLANYDTLTGLPNRYLFRDRLEMAMRKASRSDTRIGLMFIDLDNFKTINDTLGHTLGDDLLRSVAERLRNSVRAGDTVARLGGDEFTVIVEPIEEAREAGAVAQHIMSAASRPVSLAEHEICATASIGIAIYPDDAADADALIRHADTAMYRAKSQGRNNYQFFTSDMNALAQERLLLETQLRAAVDSGAFALHFQPQLDLRSGAISGFEALLRWPRAAGEPVAPTRFVPVLEENGLIVRVGEWVLHQACQAAVRLRGATGQRLSIAVNISAKQFHKAGFAQIVRSALREAGLPPDALELEITESALIEAQNSLGTMLELKTLGVRLAIDDFGTGYSSLAYLKRFPIDRLKIDRSFVRDVTTDHDDAVITQTIIAMAHSLGMPVVAEGVETREQLAFLRAHGCDQIQGYLLGRAGPEEAIRTDMEALVRHAGELAAVCAANVLVPLRGAGMR